MAFGWLGWRASASWINAQGRPSSRELACRPSASARSVRICAASAGSSLSSFSARSSASTALSPSPRARRERPSISQPSTISGSASSRASSWASILFTSGICDFSAKSGATASGMPVVR